MTYVRVPVLTLNGTEADPEHIAYPLKVSAGRSRIDQQPEPGYLSFAMPGVAKTLIPRRGQPVTLDLPLPSGDHRLFTGRVIEVKARHEPWNAVTSSTFDITALGWAAEYVGTPLGTPSRIGVATDADQYAEALELWEAAGYTLTSPPIDLDGLEDTSLRHPLDLASDANLYSTLQDLGTRSGAVVWEHPAAGISVQGPSIREAITTTAGTIGAHLIPEDLAFDLSTIINSIQVSYGAANVIEAGADPKGSYFWENSVDVPTSGQITYSTGTSRLNVRRTNAAGADATPWLQEMREGDVLAVLNATDATWSGYIITDAPLWTSGYVRFDVARLTGDWGSAPATSDGVYVYSILNPARATLTVADTGSQTTYGRKPATIDTGLIGSAPATARANQILERWSREQWIPTVEVRGDLAVTQTEWDDLVELLTPNTPVEVEDLWEQGGKLTAADSAFWVEGLTHEFDKTAGGRLTHTATLVLSPFSIPTEPTGEYYPSLSTYPGFGTYPGGITPAPEYATAYPGSHPSSVTYPGE